MADFDGKFDSSKQDWETPIGLFMLLDKRYGFNFDLAADSSNAKCSNYFTEGDDALRQEWFGHCWLNPPYGGTGANKLEKWVRKAYMQSIKKSCSVTLLIPARTNTNWWHDYCMKSMEILFIKGRPIFGNAKYGLPQPLAIITFNGNNRVICGTLDLKRMKIEIHNTQPLLPLAMPVQEALI